MRLFNSPNSVITDRERTFICSSIFTGRIFDLKLSASSDPIDAEDIDPTPPLPVFSVLLSNGGYMRSLNSTMYTMNRV